jgi:hypothetical protein
VLLDDVHEGGADDDAIRHTGDGRSLIGRAHELHEGFGPIDVCIGVSSRPASGRWEAIDLLHLADLRLNSAKRSRLRPGEAQQVWAGPPDALGPDDRDEAD